MPFLAIFSYGMWQGLQAKNNKRNIFNVGNS